MDVNNYRLFSKVIQICNTRFRLLSNREELLSFKKGLIADIETDFYKAEEIKCHNNDVDAYFYMIDEDLEIKIHIGPDLVIARGNILKMEKEAGDIRWSLLGNEGLFYRFVLKILESKRNIYSFHACSLFDEEKNRLFIVSGGEGTGKSVFLLNGIRRRLKILSTEMTHFKYDSDDLLFYKGSILDNVRIVNLKYDFPEIADELNLKFKEKGNYWSTKIVVDLSRYQTSTDEILNPQVILVFPHIERNMKEIVIDRIKEKSNIIKLSFDNITSKIGESILLYEKIPIAGIDSPTLAMNRFQIVRKLVDNKKFCKALTLFAGINNCLEEVIK